MDAIDILHVTHGAPSARSGARREDERPWIVTHVRTFDEAGELLRARFFHVVLVDDALADGLVERLLSAHGCAFPTARTLAVLPPREERPPWGFEARRVGGFLEPPWENSLAGFLDAHPAIAASAWRNFQLTEPLRLDDGWLRDALLGERIDTRVGASFGVARLAHEKQPIGHAVSWIMDALTPDYQITGILGSLASSGVEVTKARELAEWIGGCPLLGVRRRAWHVLDMLDVAEGRARLPTPLAALPVPEGWSLEGVSLRPELADSLVDTPSDPPPGLLCGACGAHGVRQTCARQEGGYHGGGLEIIGLNVEVRCPGCRAYSRYYRHDGAN